MPPLSTFIPLLDLQIATGLLLGLATIAMIRWAWNSFQAPGTNDAFSSFAAVLGIFGIPIVFVLVIKMLVPAADSDPVAATSVFFLQLMCLYVARDLVGVLLRPVLWLSRALRDGVRVPLSLMQAQLRRPTDAERAEQMVQRFLRARAAYITTLDRQIQEARQENHVVLWEALTLRRKTLHDELRAIAQTSALLGAEEKDQRALLATLVTLENAASVPGLPVLAEEAVRQRETTRSFRSLNAETFDERLNAA